MSETMLIMEGVMIGIVVLAFFSVLGVVLSVLLSLELKKVKAFVQRRQNEVESLEEDLDLIGQNEEKVKEQFIVFQKAFENNEAKFAQVVEKLNTLAEENAKFRKETREQFRKLEAEHSQAQQSIKEHSKLLGDKIAKAQHELETAKTKFESELKKVSAGTEVKVANITKDIAEREKRVLASAKTDVEKQIAQSIQTINSTITTVEKALQNSFNSQIESVKQLSESNDAQWQSMALIVNKLNSNTLQYENDLKESNEVVRKLALALATVNQRAMGAQASVGDFNQHLERVDAQLSSLLEKIEPARTVSPTPTTQEVTTPPKVDEVESLLVDIASPQPPRRNEAEKPPMLPLKLLSPQPERRKSADEFSHLGSPFKSPEPVKRRPSSSDLEGHGPVIPPLQLGNIPRFGSQLKLDSRRRRSVSTNTQGKTDILRISLQKLSTSTDGDSSDEDKNAQEKPSLKFTEEDLSVTKGTLRKVWEMIEEREELLIEREKQLILAEKEQMISRNQIDPATLVICEPIGRGAAASVFRGLWNGTPVAIKSFSGALSNGDAGFFREVELLSNLRHPNIIQYFGASVADDSEILMVLELMPKGSLYDAIHQFDKPLPLRDIFKVAKGVACGMGYLHSLTPPVIHLDLKSQNILLGPDMEPKVTDFGMSQISNEMGYSIGTPQWTAPELFEAKNNSTITTKADVYSFGVVLYEMVSGKLPFSKHHREAIPVLVNKKQKRPEIPENTPPMLRELITNCWQHNPNERPTFETILGSIDTMSTPLIGSISPIDKLPVSQRGSRRRRLMSVLEQTIKHEIEKDYDIGDDGLYGDVVEGRHLLTNEKVAIKKVEKNSTNCDKDKKILSIIVQDFQIMKGFDHPNILKISSIYEDASTIFLVLERLPFGEELFLKLVEKGQYPEIYAQHVIKQLVNALDYLHANNVAHGAVRPDNILSSGDDENEIIKLTNFGFSKLFQQERDADNAAYDAPEVVSHDVDIVRYEPTSDCWSLGVLAFALLSGLPPFYGDNIDDLISEITNVQYDFSDPEPWDYVSEHAKDFISKLLVKDPTKRLTIQQCKAHYWIKKFKPEKLSIGRSLTTPRTPRTLTPRPLQTPRHRAEKDTEKEKVLVFKDNFEEEYSMEEELGSGAYSTVFKSVSKKTKQVVAVKCIDEKRLVSNEDGEDLMKFLRREISIMKRVDHPNIIKLFEVYKSEKQFYLVMELVPDAQELFEKILDVGHYIERDACNVVIQVISAIDYLHSNGIAHRDLKPENLLSSGYGEHEVVKLMDFGFSKIYQGDSALKTAVGSPAYAAPELFLENSSYDKSIDMWSIGVITYVLLSGCPPFYGDTMMELLDKVQSADYEFDSEIWDDVSHAAKNFISLLIVKDPQRRLTAKQCLQHPWIRGKGNQPI